MFCAYALCRSFIIFLDVLCFRLRVGDLLIGFKDAAFLYSRASFSTTFVKKNCSDKILGMTASHKTVVGVSKSMLPVRCFYSNKVHFCASRIPCRSQNCYKD